MTPAALGRRDLARLLKLQPFNHARFLGCVPLHYLRHPQYRARIERRHGLMSYLINGEILRRQTGKRAKKRFQEIRVLGAREHSISMQVSPGARLSFD